MSRAHHHHVISIMGITKLMAPKPSSPSYNNTATISMCINWTKGLHHEVQGLHLYHHHQPSLGKIMASSDYQRGSIIIIIKRSSRQQTWLQSHHQATINQATIMGSTNQVQGLPKPSSSKQGTIKYVGHRHMHSPLEDHIIHLQGSIKVIYHHPDCIVL